jgi:predicted nucleotidyltransferase
VVGAFRDGLAKRFGPRLSEVVLFGSWARGEAGDESDVDVLVVVADLTESERRDVLDLAYDVALIRSDEPIVLSALALSTSQVASLRARERLLLREIDRQGVRL